MWFQVLCGGGGDLIFFSILDSRLYKTSRLKMTPWALWSSDGYFFTILCHFLDQTINWIICRQIYNEYNSNFVPLIRVIDSFHSGTVSDRRKLSCYYCPFAPPELTCGKDDHLDSIWQLSFALLPMCDYIVMQGYLICSSCLEAVSASCGPFSVRAAGRGCQLCRDALGAPLPSRAH